jgi:type IV pilus assembly protein PilB
MPAQRALAVTQMLKLLSGRDIKVRDQPQSGAIKAEYQEKAYEIRVDTAPVKGGPERLTVRIYDPKERDALKKPDDLGFTEELKTKIREMGARKKKLIVVCGPPYSGTTTTTYAVLRTVDAYIYSVFTNADLGGRDLFGVTVSEKNPDESWDMSIMRMIRSEADLIFLDPLRDAETAKLIFEKLDQTAFLTEMTAKDPAAAIQKLIEWIGDAQKVSEGLSGVITQKLLRRLCEKCREAYRPNPKLLEKMGLPPETSTLYRPPKPRPEPEPGAKEEEEYQPCKKCGGVGYLGRIGMYELVEVTDAVRALIAEGLKDPAAFKQLVRKEKMQTLQRDGMRLVLAGKTSLEELQRLFKAPS